MDQQVSPSQQAPVPSLMAPLFIMVGLAIGAAGLGVIQVDPQDFKAPHWVVTCTGGLFALIGMLIASQGNPQSLHTRFYAACFFSLFAAVFGWVGLGPGPRQFSSALSVLGLTSRTSSGETSGRVLFGAVGIATALVAVVAWYRFGTGLLQGSRPQTIDAAEE